MQADLRGDVIHLFDRDRQKYVLHPYEDDKWQAGPPVVSHAMGYDISKEELGGWQVHCCNGSVDNLAESEEEAVAICARGKPAVDECANRDHRQATKDRVVEACSRFVR